MSSNDWRVLPPLSLGRKEAHLWCVCPDIVTEPVLLDAYRELLNAQERVQQQRFYFEKGRHEYLVTRALVRTTLSRYVQVDPHSWHFEANAYGRPAIATPQGILPLRFNLSHTDGLIVCVVALDRECGIDVEDTERGGMTVDIADQFFSRMEAQDLRALPVPMQRQRFFEYWTLKESYIKARGMGVSLPLEQFSFHLERGLPIRISFAPRLKDDPSSWQFAQFCPTQSHMVAIALRRGLEPDLEIRMRHSVPLVCERGPYLLPKKASSMSGEPTLDTNK
jgi:4'-phosphopantetheinyl transferase